MFRRVFLKYTGLGLSSPFYKRGEKVGRFLENLGPYMEAKPRSLITAEPNLKMEDVYIVSGYDGKFDDGNKNVRADYKPTIHCVVKASNDGKTYYFSDIDSLSLNGKTIHPKDSGNLNGVKIKWFKVEPMKGCYTNSSFNRRWWAELDYAETQLDCNSFGMEADVTPTILTNYGNMGTMRFKVDFEYRKQKKSTPGRNSVEKRGIKDTVHRVSIRPDDTYVGHLKSFFNLPYIWGSASLKDQAPASQHQAERYIGADCADFVVAGWRAMGNKDVSYYRSSGFGKYGLYVKKGLARIIVERAYPNKYGFFFDAKTNKPIKIGDGEREVREGDIIYFGGHVGVLSKNKRPGSFLDAGDLYVETLFHEPMETELAYGFSPRFSILRWNE